MGIFDDVLTPPSGGGKKSIFEDVMQPANESVGRSRPEMGAMEAAARGAENAFSFGFSDELKGLIAASGLQEFLDKVPAPLRDSVIGKMIVPSLATMGATRLAAGSETARKDYESAVDAERRQQENAREQQPVAHTLGQVGGAVALPIGVGARAATVGGRALGAGLTGAATGGLTGLGEGETPQERLTGAGIGAGVGGAVGLVGAPVAEGVANVARAAISPVTSRIAGLTRTEDEAARRVAAAYQADQARLAASSGPATRPPPLTEQQFADLQQQGVPVALIDRLDARGASLARSAANTSPEARAALETTAQDRYQTSGARVSDWMRSTNHYPDVAAQQEAIAQAARVANPVAYRAAEQEAARLHPAGLWDEGFDQISQAPVVQDAIRKASVTGANRAAREGFTPVGNPFVLDRTTGRMVLRTDAQGNVTARPNLAFWDEVKKNLDKVGTRDATDFSRVLRDRIDELVPSYGQARAGAATFFGARDALEAGANFVGGAKKFGTLPQVQRALNEMSPAERNLFRDGYTDKIAHDMAAAGPAARTNMLNRIQNSQPAMQELRLALGNDGADQLVARLRVESVMDRMRTMLGNSTTARQMAELGFAGGAGLDALVGGVDPLSMLGGGGVGAILLGGGRALGRRIDQNVARRVGEMLASGDQSVLQRGLQILSRNPTMMQALHAADNTIARVAGQQAAQR